MTNSCHTGQHAVQYELIFLFRLGSEYAKLYVYLWKIDTLIKVLFSRDASEFFLVEKITLKVMIVLPNRTLNNFVSDFSAFQHSLLP